MDSIKGITLEDQAYNLVRKLRWATLQPRGLINQGINWPYDIAMDSVQRACLTPVPHKLFAYNTKIPLNTPT